MSDPKSTTVPPKPGAPSGDDEVTALRDAVSAIGKRLDALFKRKDDDDRKRSDDGPISTHTSEELRAELRRREEEEEGEADDDRRDRQRPDDDKDMPRRLAADDDRRDTRADAMRRRLAALDEANANLLSRLNRSRSDEEIDQLSQLQSDWDRVAMAHGVRASRPMDGEKPSTYDRRHARRFQEFSDKWKNADLSNAPRDIMAVASPEIRHDALEAAYRPAPDGGGVLREVRETDRTGRNISRFIGPVGETLGPFKLPTSRVRRIVTPHDYTYNNI